MNRHQSMVIHLSIGVRRHRNEVMRGANRFRVELVPLLCAVLLSSTALISERVRSLLALVSTVESEHLSRVTASSSDNHASCLVRRCLQLITESDRNRLTVRDNRSSFCSSISENLFPDASQKAANSLMFPLLILTAAH